jgi:hypothetical protein
MGFPSPATIYLEAVIDLAEILDLRRPSCYPVKVIGGSRLVSQSPVLASRQYEQCRSK